MQCPSCSRENRAEARFCDGCGSELERSCSGCGQVLRAEARFCDACGAPVSGAREKGDSARPAPPKRSPRDYTPRHLAEKILRSQSALQGERKQVTVR